MLILSPRLRRRARVSGSSFRVSSAMLRFCFSAPFRNASGSPWVVCRVSRFRGRRVMFGFLEALLLMWRAMF